jgi:hypothetical protein
MKPIFSKQIILLTMCMASAMTIFTIACSKQAINDISALTSNDPEIKQAQTFFINTIVKNELNTGTIGQQTLSKNIVSRVPARMSKLEKLVKWDESFQFNLNETKYVFVPVNEAVKPFKNKDFEFFRYLIFYTNADGKNDLSVIEVLSNKASSLGNDLRKIALASFKNKVLGTNTPIEHINASIIFYTQDYSRQTSFQIANGNWSNARISFRSDLEIKLKD